MASIIKGLPVTFPNAPGVIRGRVGHDYASLQREFISRIDLVRRRHEPTHPNPTRVIVSHVPSRRILKFQVGSIKQRRGVGWANVLPHGRVEQRCLRTADAILTTYDLLSRRLAQRIPVFKVWRIDFNDGLAPGLLKP